MKLKMISISLLISTSAWSGFDFGECSGSGSFEQEIKSYGGDYEKVVLVGSVPQGIQGLRVELISDKDVDIRLYGENNDKIVHWPKGILNQAYLATKSYKNVPITYSGYYGYDGKKGHEYIQVEGSTPTLFTMKAFGFESGYARVNYTWTGKDNCENVTVGTGHFEQEISKNTVALVGEIPANIANLEVNLTSTKDVDIQLYGEDGTAIVKWPSGLLHDIGKQEIDYHGMHIVWSGYNGVANQKGHEYITVTPKTSEKLTMKVYGYESGYADVNYKWGATKLSLLIIRMEFNDVQFTNDATTWHNKIFSHTTSSLNNYYKEISYGTFQFEPAKETGGTINDGIVTTKLNINHPNPGKNYTESVKFLQHMKTAISQVDSKIDFSSYDKNGDHAISHDELQIMFIVAGGESALSINPGVWARQWSYNGDNAVAPRYDGVRIMSTDDNGGYTIFGERHYEDDATIGIMAHELGHAVFKLRDLYDVDGSSKGIGYFGLMGQGAWGHKFDDEAIGQTPLHMNGWSKMKAGFVVPREVTTSSSVNLVETSSMNYNLFKIPTGKSGEYFLIENRGASGYDRGMDHLEGQDEFTGGLSILHIDDNVVTGNNNENHKLVDVEEANNAGLDTKTHSGHINNLYFSGNSDTFNDTSTPNSKRYDGQSSGVKIENISDSAAIMTADITVQ